MKRIISMILAVVMAFTLIPGVNVRAEESPPGEDAQTADSITFEGASAQALAGEEAAGTVYYDGKYTGTAEGYHGTDFPTDGSTGMITVSEIVKATVTIAGGKITAIDVEFTGNDGALGPTYQGMAKPIVNSIITSQTTEGVDTISGATSTSKGIKNAVSAALEKAKTGAPFEDGAYVTESVIWKTSADTGSMAGGVLAPLTTFEVVNGKPVVTFMFQETSIMGIQSYLTDIGYFKSKDDLTAYQSGDTSKLIKGTVVETMKIQPAGGGEVVTVPKKIQFTFDDFADTYYIYLFSNMMNSDARIKIYYEKATDYKAVESIELSDSEILLNEEQTYKVSAKVLPQDATDPELTWSSSDADIATVDSAGTITAVKEGSVQIIATAKNGVQAAVQVNVKKSSFTFEKTSDTTAALTGASEDTSYLKIPEKTEIDGKEYTVTSIADEAFKGNEKIRSLVLSASITTIGQHAFDGTKLQNLTLTDSVTEVEDYAFANITTLETAVLSSNLQSLGEGAFQNDTALSSVNIPETLTKISKGVFKNCSSLIEIKIPSSVITIEKEAFAGCRKLTGIGLNEGLETIGEKAFHLDSSLNNLIIPASVTNIGKQAFARNLSLTDIEITGDKTTFGADAFALHGEDSVALVTESALETYEETLKEAGFTGKVSARGVLYTYDENEMTAEASGYAGTLDSVTIPETIKKGGKEYRVTSMARNLFQNNTTLRYAEIPGSVSSVSYDAFSGCMNLEKVVLKEGVKAIENTAFLDCVNLKEVVVPSTLADISEQSIFNGCTSLKGLNIPDGVTIIGRMLLYGTSVTEFTIPESVTTINEYAFASSALEEITIPKNVKTMGASVFNTCKNLKRVTVEDGATGFGNTFFAGCTNLETIIFKGTTVPTFTKSTFGSTVPATAVAIVPSGMKEAYETALTAAGFTGTVTEAEQIGITYSVNGETAVVTGYTGKMEIAVVPSTVEIDGTTYPVQSIAQEAFKDSSYLKEVVIPDSVKTIGAGAFSGCTLLKRVVIEGSLNEIGTNAFSGCVSVSSLDFTKAASVPTTVGNNAFYQVPKSAVAKVRTNDAANYKKALADGNYQGIIEGLIRYEIVDGKAVLAAYEEDTAQITIPDEVTINGTVYEVTGIKEGVFKNNTNITSVVLPDSITVIPKEAFYGAEKLEKVTFSKKLTEIGKSAFYGCKALAEIKSDEKVNELPKTLDSIGAYAFYNNSSLTALLVTNAVTRIESYTFYGCTALAEFDLPDNLTYIGQYAFSLCQKMTEFDLPKTLVGIGDYAFQRTGVTEIMIPENITDIADGLFQSSTLEKVTLPKGLLSIGSTAFSGTPLTEVTIPDKITELSTSIFNGCTKLTKVNMGDNITSIGASAFRGCTLLTEGDIPDSVTSLGTYAFYGTGYKEILVPESVTTVDRYAFANCLSLKKITFESQITTLPYYALDGCKALETVVLPESLKTIDRYAFRNTSSLKELVIPKNVDTINIGAFSGTDALVKYIYKNPKAPTITASIYSSTAPTNAVATVPAGSKESYETALSKVGYKGTVQAYMLSLELNETEVSLIKGSSLQLSTQTIADDVEDKTLIWASNDTTVATVSDTGLVQAVSQGKATVTVSASNGVSTTCTVYVTTAAVAADSITLSDASVTLEAGSSYTAKVTIAPADTTDRKITWSSADTSIATVDANGTITAVSSGETVITAATANGKTAKTTVTVSPQKLADGAYLVPVKMLNETSDQASMANGAMEQEAALIVKGDETKIYLTFKTLKVGTLNGHVTQGWYFENKENYEGFKASGDSSLRSDFAVESCFVEDKTAYLQQISLTASTGTDEVYLQTYVDAMQSAPYTRLSIDYASAKAVTKVDADSIKITNQDIELEKGESLQLTASVTPEDTTLITGFTWESDAPEVVSVDEKTGFITANKTGTTTIYAYTKDNLTAEAQVTVVSQAEIKDNETALQLVKDIDALPEAKDITASNAAQVKKDIKNILETYNGLYDGAKAKVTNISVLDSLQERITEVEKEIAGAEALDEEIGALPKIEKITVVNAAEVKETVTSIRAKYEVLNDAAKALVTKLDTLTSVEDQIARMEQEITLANTLNEQIEALPGTEEIQFSSVAEVKASVTSIKEQYNGLSDGAKNLVTGYAALAPIEERIAGLETEISLADELTKEISGLPAAEGINYSNAAEVKKTIAAIREEYAALEDATKELVTNYGTMDTLSDKIAEVEASMEEGNQVVRTIREVPDFDKDTTPEEWMEIVQQVEEIEEAFDNLDSDGKGVASERFNKLMAQIKAVNQETDDITVFGLDWHYKVVTAANTTEAYDKAKEKADTAGKNLLAVLDINIVDLRDNSEVTQLPGNIKVTVKAEGDWSGYDTDSIIVLHYKDGELIEELKGTYNGDGTISFETDSFSTYAITAAVKVEATNTLGTPDTGSSSGTTAIKTGDTQSWKLILMTGLLSLAVAAGASYSLARKRKIRR